MSRIPVHSPATFGSPSRSQDQGTPLSVIDVLGCAPEPRKGAPRPAVSRLLSAQQANLIVFTFLPGQSLPEHKAAHPITVQCVQGALEFCCGNDTVALTAGMVCHLPAYAVHSVACPEREGSDATAAETSILLLTMLTPPEDHPATPPSAR